MDNHAWQRRLAAAIEADGRPLAEISREAEVGRNYVQQMTKYNKTSRTDYVLRVCRALNVSPAYIFAGIEISAEAEELVQRFQKMPEQEQEAFLVWLRARSSIVEAP